MAGNANSGRRRKPKGLRDLHGSVERPHHRDRPEPQYAVELPEPPASLDKVARKEWDRVTALLHAQRVIAKVDLATVAVYCTLFERLETIRKAIAMKGFDPLKDGKEHPLLKLELRYAGQLRPYLTELGLTPASRARVSPLPPLGADEPEAPVPAPDAFDVLEARLTGRKVVSIGDGRRTKKKK